MQWLKTGLAEVYGLFVEDAAFAAAIALWLVVVGLLAWELHISSGWLGGLLFLGLAAVLVESTTRYARQRRRRSGSKVRE